MYYPPASFAASHHPLRSFNALRVNIDLEGCLVFWIIILLDMFVKQVRQPTQAKAMRGSRILWLGVRRLMHRA